ncbi:MAG: hypothetical protein JW808_05220 [Victivallales bacterium]|nr:hypothetical protein [Victivallales bacterium]
MALRIDKEIVRGWIDNTVGGKVIGEITIEGRDEPVRLQLEGNCHRDLAGSRCEFKNPSPILNRRLEINSEQTGRVGDMTASRRARVPDIPYHEYFDQKAKGLNPSEHWANVLYLEWFSEHNGRVVIELPDADIDVTLPEWKMTPEEEKRQKKNNFDNLTNFLDELVEAKKPVREANLDGDMDEFEWELFLKESDARSEKYGELLDKFMDHPNREEIVCKQMGWNLEAIVNAKDDFPDDFDMEEEVPTAFYERKRHPLAQRMGNLWLTIHRFIEGTPYHHSQDDVGLMISDLIFNIQFASAKSGSVLDDAASYDDGMVIAILKRAITGIHKAIDLAGNQDVAKALADIIEPAREELFAIREEMMKQMDKRRKT